MESWCQRIGEIRGDRITALPRWYEYAPVLGVIKNRPSDFLVEEIPLYPLEGNGPHLYFEVKKRGWTTEAVQHRIADHMNVPLQEVGSAGRKDRDAITIQRMSLEHADPEHLTALDAEGIQIQVLGWHRNKLKSGHLAGNRFRIKVREIPQGSIDWDERVRALEARGVPNYFGRQRFGRRGDTAELGGMLIRDELQDFIRSFFGSPESGDPDRVYRARELFEQGDFRQALQSWPSDSIRARALETYIRRESPGAVLSEIPRSQRQLFVSAFQARCFNEQVGARMDHLGTVFKGDIAKKQDTGGLFVVKEEKQEQSRAKAGRIHATGSLPGTDTWQAEGKQGRLETQSLKKFGLSAEDFERVSYLGASGTRRAMRIMPKQFAVDEKTDNGGPYLDVRFRIRSGAYATMVLRELMGDSETG